jgi:hypothetical protein
MSNDPLRQMENYEAKLRLGAAGPLSDSEIQARVTRYGMFAAKQTWLVATVRQILCSAGIVPMMFTAYHCFSREMDKLSRQDYSIETKEGMMVALADKWVMRGLSRPVLLSIAAVIFNIAPPATPSEQHAGKAESDVT